jgi:hypothetical protein
MKVYVMVCVRTIGNLQFRCTQGEKRKFSQQGAIMRLGKYQFPGKFLLLSLPASDIDHYTQRRLGHVRSYLIYGIKNLVSFLL